LWLPIGAQEAESPNGVIDLCHWLQMERTEQRHPGPLALYTIEGLFEARGLQRRAVAAQRRGLAGPALREGHPAAFQRPNWLGILTPLDHLLAEQDYPREIEHIRVHAPVIGPRPEAISLDTQHIKVGCPAQTIDLSQKEEITHVAAGALSVGRHAPRDNQSARIGGADCSGSLLQHRHISRGIDSSLAPVGVDVGPVPDLVGTNLLAIPLRESSGEPCKGLRIRRRSPGIVGLVCGSGPDGRTLQNSHDLQSLPVHQRQNLVPKAPLKAPGLRLERIPEKVLHQRAIAEGLNGTQRIEYLEVGGVLLQSDIDARAGRLQHGLVGRQARRNAPVLLPVRTHVLDSDRQQRDQENPSHQYAGEVKQRLASRSHHCPPAAAGAGRYRVQLS